MTPSLSPQADAFLVDYFQREILPLLTPVALDPFLQVPGRGHDHLPVQVRAFRGAYRGKLACGRIDVVQRSDRHQVRCRPRMPGMP